MSICIQGVQSGVLGFPRTPLGRIFFHFHAVSVNRNCQITFLARDSRSPNPLENLESTGYSLSVILSIVQGSGPSLTGTPVQSSSTWHRTPGHIQTCSAWTYFAYSNLFIASRHAGCSHPTGMFSCCRSER